MPDAIAVSFISLLYTMLITTSRDETCIRWKKEAARLLARVSSRDSKKVKGPFADLRLWWRAMIASRLGFV